LVIDNFNTFQSLGILIADEAGNLISGNYIGTDFTGTQAAGNRVGIEVATQGVQGSVISGNLISGNSTGVLLEVTDDNRVVGNRIGTNAAGTQALGNSVGVQDTGGERGEGRGWPRVGWLSRTAPPPRRAGWRAHCPIDGRGPTRARHGPAVHVVAQLCAVCRCDGGVSTICTATCTQTGAAGATRCD
jgi:parallel beta-helix repeat protein